MTPRLKLAAAALMFCLAGLFAFNFWRNHRELPPQIYFYDLSEKKLFAASQDAVPPIAGADGKEEDAVRAIVYSPSGNCAKDKKIAYLEKYSPQLKAEFETAKKNPGLEFPRMSRGAAQGHTFVCRPGDTNWVAMDSPEAALIVGEWRLNLPSEPTICLP